MVAVGGIASMLALAGCTSTPDEPLPVPTSAPSTTPTPEYTPGLDAEADVEAAIKTYEAYVEASNNLVIADRETWDPVLELLLDDYKASSITTYEDMLANGESFTGTARVLSTEADGVEKDVLRLHVCTDFSDVFVLDRNGLVVGEPEGDGIRSMNVVFEPVTEGTARWSIGYFGKSDRPC